jgi:predicted TIM-barrel fold metal-dependent hydrolase
MGYVDAHVHVWTDDYERLPFAPGHDPSSARPTTFHAADILGHARPCGVERIVLVQMSYYGDDNRYMLETMQRHPGVFGGIGIVDWAAPDPGAAMGSLADASVYGFRVYPRDVPVDRWCEGDGFSRMFETGAERRLAICPLIGPDALPALARRCEQHPDTPVIIDHLCRIGAAGPIETEHIDALCAMARFEQVMVKVSAFYALGDKAAPYHDLTDLIRRVVDAFGPRRLMWASDAPYQVQPPHTYAASVALMTEGLDFLSDEDRDWILGRTAAAFFFRD